MKHGPAMPVIHDNRPDRTRENPGARDIRVSGHLPNLLRRRISPPPTDGLRAKQRHEPNLDALRGFAACSVLSCHVLAFHTEGDTSFNPPSEWLAYLHFSRSAVLIFFLLSGYVIGLNYRAVLKPAEVGEYLRRRALRLLPIYWMGLALGWCAIFEPDALKIIGNLLFLQNDAGPIHPTYGNYPVWSLHYEAVYYLSFIVVLKWAPRLVPLAGGLLLFSLLGWFQSGVLSVIGGWSVGACFWLSGLLLAWHGRAAEAKPLLAPLLALYAANHLWPGIILFNGLGLAGAGTAGINVADLFLLPGCLLVFSAVTGREFPGLRLVRLAAFAIPAGTVIILFLLGRLDDSMPWLLGAVAIVASLALLRLERSDWGIRLLCLFAPIGAISYALYLFHMPILLLAKRLRRADLVNYATALALTLGLSFGLAWIVERKLQPWIVRRFRPNQGPRPEMPVPCASS